MNKTNINNPNNDSYWQARDYPKRPKNWKKLISKESNRQKNRRKYLFRFGFNDDGLGPLYKADY